jgi:hypothetical protein
VNPTYAQVAAANIAASLNDEALADRLNKLAVDIRWTSRYERAALLAEAARRLTRTPDAIGPVPPHQWVPAPGPVSYGRPCSECGRAKDNMIHLDD